VRKKSFFSNIKSLVDLMAFDVPAVHAFDDLSLALEQYNDVVLLLEEFDESENHKDVMDARDMNSANDCDEPCSKSVRGNEPTVLPATKASQISFGENPVISDHANSLAGSNDSEQSRFQNAMKVLAPLRSAPRVLLFADWKNKDETEIFISHEGNPWRVKQDSMCKNIQNIASENQTDEMQKSNPISVGSKQVLDISEQNSVSSFIPEFDCPHSCSM
jgi:hypothetical protein